MRIERNLQACAAVSRAAGWAAAGLAVSLACAPVSAAQSAPPAQPPRTAEQVYKNIQAFRGAPASLLMPTMSFFAGSLGVDCDHCHVPNQWEKDDKPTKLKARQMIQMVMALNRTEFRGELSVNCFTCHRGSTRPATVPPVFEASVAPPAPKSTAPLPAVEEIFARYQQAVAGRADVTKLTTRAMKGVLETGGPPLSYEQTMKAPDKSIAVLTTPRGVSHQAFDGTAGWSRPSAEAPARDADGVELGRARRDSRFFPACRVQDYAQLKVTGREKIGAREVYVVEGTPLGDLPETLYFDVENGLLLRVVRRNAHLLGAVPMRTDFEDYREVDGVMLPFAVRRSRTDFVFTVRWQEIRHNVPVDDTLFQKPAPK